MTDGRPFAPDVTGGQSVGAVNARFLLDAERWNLRYRCADCAHVRRDGRCSFGFPNHALRREPFVAVADGGVPQLCKSFEADQG